MGDLQTVPSDQVVQPKKWWQSKTVRANILMLIAAIVANIYGRDVITPDIQAVAMVVINLILRAVTKQPVEM